MSHPQRGRITALAGGVGASKFLWGLARAAGQERLTIVGNTGDDIELHGLHISPDLDIVTYTLAGIADPDKGWGVHGDTFHGLEMLGRYGRATWFTLGDRDLATHIFRSERLRAGETLTEVTDMIRTALGVRARILPMTDGRVETHIRTDEGLVHFQEYLVQRGARDPIRGVVFVGVESARATPQAVEAIRSAGAVLLCPSNPIASLGPVLALKEIRSSLAEGPAPVVAISPIVAGRSLKGPTDRFLAHRGLPVSPVGVAELYCDFLDLLVIDRADEECRGAIEAMAIRVEATDTVMAGPEEKVALARFVCEILEEVRRR